MFCFVFFLQNTEICVAWMNRPLSSVPQVQLTLSCGGICHSSPDRTPGIPSVHSRSRTGLSGSGRGSLSPPRVSPGWQRSSGSRRGSRKSRRCGGRKSRSPAGRWEWQNTDTTGRPAASGSTSLRDRTDVMEVSEVVTPATLTRAKNNPSVQKPVAHRWMVWV